MTSLSLFQQFIAVCSSDRLDAYRVIGDNDIDVLTRYLWNAALCESLYPALHCLEIGLRNRLSESLAHSYGRTDWYEDPGVVLDFGSRQKVSAVKLLLKEEGKEITPSQVIAELSFGFWTTLISARYHKTIWERPGLLRAAFPLMPKPIRKRGILARRFGEARKLRNRVFHYRPIWHRGVQREHQNIVEALSWLDPCLQSVLGVLDRFAIVCTDSFRLQIKDKLIRACPVESRERTLRLSD
jgi:hypothetical protein